MHEHLAIEELEFSLLDRAARRRVQAAARRVSSVDALLEVLSPSDRALVEQLVLPLAPPPPPPLHGEGDGSVDAERPPPLGAPDAAWRAWCRAFRLEAAYDGFVRERVDHWMYGVGGGDLRVSEVLTATKTLPRARSGPSWPQAVVWSLQDEARRNALTLALQAEREPARHTPPPAGLLRGWEAVHAARRALGPLPASVVLRRVRLRVDADAAQLEAVLSPRAGTATATLDLDAGRVETRGAVDPALFDAMLDWFATPGPERDLLARHLTEPPWRRAWDRLLEATHVPPLPPDEDKRLLGFEVRLDEVTASVHPVQCRPRKRGGGWATRRVHPNAVPPALLRDRRDREVVGALATGPAGHAAALAALVGHPRVFLAGDGVVPVHPGRASLGLRRTEAGAVRLTFDLDGAPVDPARGGGVLSMPGLVVDTLGGALRVTRLDGPLQAAFLALRRGALEVPDDALGALLEHLPELSATVPVDAEPGVLGAPLAGDPRPLVVLRWSHDTLSASALVQPLPEAPPTRPGEGAALVCGRRDGRLVHHHRDLATEAADVGRRLAEVDLTAETQVTPFEWVLTDPQRALALVDRLRTADGFVVRWEGERLGVTAADATALRLRVSSGRDWFGVEGGLTVGGGTVELATLMRAALEGHRYVPIARGQWVALGDALRDRLAAVAGVSGGGALHLGPLHAPLVSGLVDDGATLEAPPEWLTAQARVAEARTLVVEVPEGLSAALRDYQREGFTWLSRLAHWATGAVLADDMGLGKTVQAIALLLRRAPLGPALVVAPTSVVGNWLRELARFAPSLRVGLHAGPRRAERLADLGPGEVCLVTYGVLVNDQAAFSERLFATAIADEAQAFKNPDRQRARAVHALRADFRVALSGTPVENRTEDLYALMGFTAPGLLGGRAGFAKHFAEPIDARGDAGRRAALAALVAPFVLRRTKAAVAPELPPRTEIELPVVLGADERALYERLRLEALARIEAAGRRRSFQILEELTRLRRQACHPRLTDPASPVPSAKCQQAVRLLRDLREGGHRVLVFSTMVSHLELVRDALAPEGFTWCWLDGSVPQKRRQAEVDRFQAGRADLFLISLKAGGTGLNLTAADYVVHLDPWWNPAAEDQASDRAHRLGQDKPVTVYRLVAANTVEEQIVALHAHKRELADALLSGAGSTELPDLEALATLVLGARGDADALQRLARGGRPAVRVGPSDGDP